MRHKLSRTAALVACLGLLCIQSAEAQYEREYQTVNDAAETASLASYNSFDASDCNSCSDGSCGSCTAGGLGLGQGFLDRPGQLFFGAEYIYARASFSEALAYVLTDVNLTPDVGNQFIEFDFDYQSSYRFYGGYQFCDCGGAILFNFARYRSDAAFNVVEGTGMEIVSPYEVDPPGTGADGQLSGFADVEINSYDLSFAKTIPIGTLGCCCEDPCCGDTCCDDTCCDCGDSCGCCWCPAWDFTWSAGLRFAEVGWQRGTIAADNLGDQVDSATTNLDFEGAGARVGLLGRRYIGRQGFMSIYAKGDISLLVGDMSIRTITVQDPDGTAPFAAESHRNSGRRVIPVTEIEAGLSAHVGNHITLSSGYFISAWHDLGMRDEYEFEEPGGAGRFQLSHYDDANILGFDGFFARAEIAY